MGAPTIMWHGLWRVGTSAGMASVRTRPMVTMRAPVPVYSSLRASLVPVPRLTTRTLHTTLPTTHSGISRPAPGTGIKVTFLDPQGKEIKTVEGNEGDDLLSIAHEYDIDLEGACERSIACSTCHVILEEDDFMKLDEPSDDENDMLDLAFGLTDTSRLGCQVYLSKDLDGMRVQLP